MARYTGPDCRQCRREGEKLFLKGEKCYSEKCPFFFFCTPPGQHGADRKKNSEYATQLREKQKTKRIYGLCEKQFRGYYDKAEKMRGITGENMLILLERRLDNVVFRLGLGLSRAHARQIVNHGHITVNGSRVNIPSYLVKAGDVITIRESKKDNSTIKINAEESSKRPVPAWLDRETEKLSGKVIRLASREDIDIAIEEHLIVELYSK